MSFSTKKKWRKVKFIYQFCDEISLENERLQIVNEYAKLRRIAINETSQY